MSDLHEDQLNASTPEVSRRAFVSGSAALLATALLPIEAGAQALARASSAAAPVAASNIPHDFGLRGAPVHTRAPLTSAPYAALPLGSIKARGWLLKQLELQRDGLTGHAEEIYPATRTASSNKSEVSAWRGGEGDNWERSPYYVKGLVSLAYTLDDPGLKEKVLGWIEPILQSQRPDGFFGPTQNDDWWPRMVATYLLRDYCEASGDKRVLTVLTNYYRHMSNALPARPLSSWGKARAGDEIDTVLWLYNRTGDEFLLPLSDLLARQCLPWTDIFTTNGFMQSEDEWMVNHAVNVPQALKMPVVYSQRSGRAEDKAAYRAALTHLMRDHGTSFGINTGTERLCGRSSVEGVETCSTVEHMLSAETAIRILGDARIGDELEVIAFNALPAAFSKNFHQHVYYTLSNNVKALKGHVGYLDDHGNDRVVAPQSGFPCCCYNMHMGWPKLTQNAWAATGDGGLAAMTYVPSQVSLPLPGGEALSVTCETNYPFEETVKLSVALDRSATFPLQLRIPAWCEKPVVKVNGKAVKGIAPGSFAKVSRAWKNGDLVEISFPMTVRTLRGINNSVSIRRGPLVYALGLKENEKVLEKGKIEGYDSYELTSDSVWNYALDIAPDSFKVLKKPGNDNPFETGQAPVAIQVKARRLNDWTMRPDGMLSLDPPLSPVVTVTPIETLELVPFGSQMLRVSEFPVLGTPEPLSADWSEEFTPDYADRWIFHGGGTLTRRQMRLPKGAKGTAAAAVFSDCVYEGEVTVGDTGDAGLIFRASAVSVGVDNYFGYYVGINAENNSVLFGRSRNAWQPIASARKEIEANRTHHLKVEVRGLNVMVWVDDMTTPALISSDDAFTTGTLGVRSYSNKASFGKLKAKSI